MEGDIEIFDSKSEKEPSESIIGKLIRSFFKALAIAFVLTIPVYMYVINNMPQTSPGIGESIFILLFFVATLLVLFLVFLAISVGVKRRRYVLGILVLVFIAPICIGIYYGPLRQNCLSFSKAEKGWCYYNKAHSEKNIKLCEKSAEPNKCVDDYHINESYYIYKNMNSCLNTPRPDSCFYGYAKQYSHRSGGNSAATIKNQKYPKISELEKQTEIEKVKKTFENACSPIVDVSLRDKCFSFLNDFMKER